MRKEGRAILDYALDTLSTGKYRDAESRTVGHILLYVPEYDGALLGIVPHLVDSTYAFTVESGRYVVPPPGFPVLELQDFLMQCHAAEKILDSFFNRRILVFIQRFLFRTRR